MRWAAPPKLDADPFVEGLNADPDAPMGEKEGTTGAEHHEQAAKPDHPDAGVLAHLQTGVVALLDAEQGDRVGTAAFFIELRVILEHDERRAVLVITGIDTDLGSRAEALVTLGIAHGDQVRTARQSQVLALLPL